VQPLPIQGVGGARGVAMTQVLMWWLDAVVPDRSDQRCPCGAWLKRPAERAHGVCDGCRVDAHKRPVVPPPEPGYIDVPLPGFEEWGIR
jgi:hypothetical protein